MNPFTDFFSSPIQLGFDIATSLTIIGSLFYFVISMRRRAREDRSQRFDKQVRAVAAEQLRISIDTLSRVYIESVIESSENFKKAFGLSPGKNFDMEINVLKKKGRLEVATEKLSEASDAVGRFYETLHIEKYSIIPVIDSIEDDEKLVEQFNEQMHRIALAYNRLNSSARPLVKSLMRVYEEVGVFCKDKEVSGHDDFLSLANDSGDMNTFMNMAAAIVYDEDYLFWTESFVPDDSKKRFSDSIKNTSSLKEMDDDCKNIFLGICGTVISKFFDEPEEFYAQVFWAANSRQTESNTACKEVLINLSSILKYLLKSDSDSIRLSETIESYKTDKYFDLDSAIR